MLSQPLSLASKNHGNVAPKLRRGSNFLEFSFASDPQHREREGAVYSDTSTMAVVSALRRFVGTWHCHAVRWLGWRRLARCRNFRSLARM